MTMFGTVVSADGTRIAYEQSGSGPVLIFVSGAFNDRSRCAALAQQLTGHFTVITYDRRARGDSGGNAPYAVEREIDDLNALITDAGGSAFVFGYSSGALLAFLAAAAGSAITRLVAYEPPLPLDGHSPRRPADLPEQLIALVEEGRRGDAVELFQIYGIGLPPEVVAQIRQAPFWPGLEAMAPSTVYDALLTQPGTVTSEILGTVLVPTMLLSGAETSPSWLGKAADAVAADIPGAERRVLEGGADHDFDTTPLAPLLVEFLRGRA
jgi:pimeloyl-ACP methyl ester carboxylesterase